MATTLIGVRTRNRSGLLQEAVTSVLAQTDGRWRLLLSDDASTDGTAEYGRRLAASDVRVEYARHDPIVGFAANLRFGFARFRDDPVSASFAAHLDDDNRWAPTFLEEMRAALDRHPDAAFAFSDEWAIGPDGRRDLAASDAASANFGRGRLVGGRLAGGALRAAAVTGAMGINSAVIRRDALVAVGGFRTAAGDLSDLDLFLALADSGRPAVYVAKRLVEYRVHPVRVTASFAGDVGKAREQVAILEHYRFSGTAERLRIDRLASARAGLARTLALAGRIGEARGEMWTAWRLRPGHPKTAASLAMLHLPPPVTRLALRAKYGPIGRDRD